MLLSSINEDNLLGDKWIIINCHDQFKHILFSILEAYSTPFKNDHSIPVYFSVSDTLLKSNEEIIISEQFMQSLLHFILCTPNSEFEMSIEVSGDNLPFFYLHSDALFNLQTTDVLIGKNKELTIIGKVDIQWCPICGFVLSNIYDEGDEDDENGPICMNENCFSC